MKLFSLDSPVTRFLSRMGDLMILNVITLFLCILIIPAGAAMTALHYVSLKMVRGEEGYIVRDYFKSFKQNFGQATVIWLIEIAFIFVFYMDYNLLVNGAIKSEGLFLALVAVGIILATVSMFIFPVLSHFENGIFRTIKNGAFMSMMAAPKSLAMLVLYAAPIGLMLLSANIVPLVLLFGLSLPTYVSAMMYSKTFKKFEPEEDSVSSDQEFHVVLEEKTDDEE